MTAKILLLEDQNKWYLDNLIEASSNLSDETIIASVRYARANLDQVLDIVVCTSETRDANLLIEMFDRGAKKVVRFDKNVENLRASLQSNLNK